MSNKKQTAVEWLVEQILKNKGARVISTSSFYIKDEIVNQAKELEKQQIIDTWTDGKYCNTIGNQINYEDGEQYYTETYEK